ncbi:MAG: AraC family transcriptional regulator [Proteobacteria bacterium]|nr:AraC family transcriptional regulator [Pseudomonadota bacterium]
MRESTIAAGFARALMDLAVEKGASRQDLAERSKIDLEELDDPDNRIAFAKYIALMRAGQELAGDPALALHFGGAFDIAELSIVGLIGQAAETAADALEQLDRYTNLVADVEVDDPSGKRLVLTRIGGQLWLIDRRKNPNDFPEMTESSFARMARGSARLPGGTRFIREVHVTHAAPSYRAEYDRIFQVPVFFESDKNALLLTDDSWLRIKSQNPSRYVFGLLSKRAEALLESLQSSASTRARVESLLIPILHTGNTNMDAIAAKMALSRQTLLRKLKAEGATFEKVLDQLRHKLALHYLSEKKVSMTETAYLVGFSEQAAFSRAFKRWTGASPREMRKRGLSHSAN